VACTAVAATAAGEAALMASQTDITHARPTFASIVCGVDDSSWEQGTGATAIAAQVMAATGTEPVILDAPGRPHRAVADAARDFDASLVITGSRSMKGLAALGSVSERIAHAAPCSVLVVRS
jgi:nucleotide-binding universal stress UspA family protein